MTILLALAAGGKSLSLLFAFCSGFHCFLKLNCFFFYPPPSSPLASAAASLFSTFTLSPLCQAARSPLNDRALDPPMCFRSLLAIKPAGGRRRSRLPMFSLAIVRSPTFETLTYSATKTRRSRREGPQQQQQQRPEEREREGKAYQSLLHRGGINGSESGYA